MNAPQGFPLEKSIQYAELRKPLVINNLESQFFIMDRREVYRILSEEGIDLPRYAILNRDKDEEEQFEEQDDHVVVNGVIFNKPFVEKPVDAEDHNIIIYYPASAGGGSQRLFRKIGSRSSVFSPESNVRREGSYIYEDFMATDGTDVKVYTVGPDYAHAEARKSPALDGKVERNSEGKEVRYPVILSNKEKLIARKVCLAFNQTVCGFDLLRANGRSCVCDVNGFSFVKNSHKYYDDCSNILGNMILRELAPTLHIPWIQPFQLDDPPIVPTTVGKMMELRCVVAVVRHGDRTPKQKMKLEVKHPMFFDLFKRMNGFSVGHIKLKKPKHLQEVLDIARFLIAEIEKGGSSNEVIEEKKNKLEQVIMLTSIYVSFLLSNLGAVYLGDVRTLLWNQQKGSAEISGRKFLLNQTLLFCPAAQGPPSKHVQRRRGSRRSFPPACSQVGRGAHPHRPGAGRGAGQSVPVHVPGRPG